MRLPDATCCGYRVPEHDTGIAAECTFSTIITTEVKIDLKLSEEALLNLPAAKA